MGFWIFVIALAVIWLLFSKKKKSPPPKVNSKIITKINHSSQHKSLNQPASSVTNMHSQASDDDELATFSFVNGQAVEYSTSRQPSRESAARSNTTPARWVKPGESITIQNVVINHGHFICVGRLKTHSSGEYGYLYNDGSDASLVNDSLSIEPGSRHYYDESLGYWPTFATSPLAAVVPILTGWQAIAAMRVALLAMFLSIFMVLNAAYWQMAHKNPFLTMNSKHYLKRYRA